MTAIALASFVTLATVGCGLGAGSPAEPCPAARQVTLIATRLSRAAPSPPFTVPPNGRVWVATTANDAPSLLINGSKAVATVSAVRDGGTPAVTVDADGLSHSHDPSAVLRAARQFKRLPVAAGTWRVYSVDAGGDAFPVTAITCGR